MNWYDDPGALAAKLTALIGAAAGVVSLVVSAVQEGGWPDVEGVTHAIVALVVAALAMAAELRARKAAIAPSTAEAALRPDVVAAPGKPNNATELLDAAVAARS